MRCFIFRKKEKTCQVYLVTISIDQYPRTGTAMAML
jgi:hypothetical protein